MLKDIGDLAVKKKQKKKHNANCRYCCCDFMSTDQGHFFCMYYFVYTSASTSRENFMASRRADKHTTHEKSNSWERIHRTLPFHLTSTRRAHRLCANGLICCFNVAFSVIDCSFSIKNGFTDADCLFLGSHVFLKAGHPVDCCKLTVKGILSSLLQYLSLSFSLTPPGLLSGRFLPSTLCLLGDHYTERGMLERRAE